MRVLLSLLVGLFLLSPFYSWGISKTGAMQINGDTVSEYEIVIKMLEYGNVMDKAMDVLIRNGMIITKAKQIYLTTEQQELRMSIKSGNNKQINEMEYQLPNVLNAEFFLHKKKFNDKSRHLLFNIFIVIGKSFFTKAEKSSLCNC